MRSFYLATGIDNIVQAQSVAAQLRANGWKQTYDWTVHGSVLGKGGAKATEIGNAKAQGVREADLVLVLLPGGKGTHAELGIATGLRKPVVVYSADPVIFNNDQTAVRPSVFYFTDNVTRVLSLEHVEVTCRMALDRNRIGNPKVRSAATLNEYQRSVMTFADYPKFRVEQKDGSYSEPVGWIYPALGLAGEAGETVDKIKKVLRNTRGTLSEADRVALFKELGDELWYVAALAHELGYSLQEVATGNIAKLVGREDRGTLHGQGDER